MIQNEWKKLKRFYFQVNPREDQEPATYKAIRKIFLKKEETEVPIDANALIIVPEKVTFANDDRSIRPFVLIKTDDSDYKQVSRVRKMWIVLIDIRTSYIVHVNEQRLRGDISVNYKTV